MDTQYYTRRNTVIEETEDYPDRYTVRGWRGVAFYVAGYQVEADDDTEWSGYYNRTGMLLAVMVGDDKYHVVDPADLTPLSDGEYCPECGQVGCTAGCY